MTYPWEKARALSDTILAALTAASAEDDQDMIEGYRQMESLLAEIPDADCADALAISVTVIKTAIELRAFETGKSRQHCRSEVALQYPELP
jgi:Holliday junction resolvasome RuvABC endonuclease subunit